MFYVGQITALYLLSIYIVWLILRTLFAFLYYEIYKARNIVIPSQKKKHWSWTSSKVLPVLILKFECTHTKYVKISFIPYRNQWLHISKILLPCYPFLPISIWSSLEFHIERRISYLYFFSTVCCWYFLWGLIHPISFQFLLISMKQQNQVDRSIILSIVLST